jgi:release factor glutamine methyltransferase
VRRREAGEPLEVLVGSVEFCGLRLRVAPGVFVPRQRTGLLARLAVAAASPGEPAVELCCGVAPVGCVLASRGVDVEVHAADVDPMAVECARSNLVTGDVHLGDGYAALPARLRGRVAVLAANAPYVPEEEVGRMPPEARLHEPTAALSGGTDGLDVQRLVVADAPWWLRPGGALLVETGLTQAARTAALMRAVGLATTLHTDHETGGCVVAGRDLRRAARA